MFWLLIGFLLVGACIGPLVAAIADNTWPLWAGMACGTAAVLAAFAHVTHGTDTKFAWWVAAVLFCATGAAFTVAAWWLRPLPALGGAVCLVGAVAITWSQISGTEEGRPLDPHPDSSFHIVAIGDSYMSGEGALQYFHGTDDLRTNTCHRAATAYPYLVADELDASLTFAACSGARTIDVLDRGQHPHSEGVLGASPQIDVLRDAEHVDVVLVSIGGNDAGFAEIGAACAAPGQPDCRQSAQYWVKRLETKVLPALTRTYTKIREATSKPVFALTYPNPVGSTYCRDIELNHGELAFVRDIFARRLNDLIRFAAARAQVRVIDLENSLAGHRICEVRLGSAAVNFIALGRTRGTTVDLSMKGLIGLAHGTLHPNVSGHQLMYREVLRVVQQVRAGHLDPLPAPPPPDAGPPPEVPPEVGPPVGPHEFPSHTDCAGTEISVTTPMSVEPAVETISLDHLRGGSTVCFRTSGDAWRSRAVGDSGEARVPIDVRNAGIGSINEVLAQEEGGAWKKLVVSRLAQPGDDEEPAKPSYLMLIVAAGVSVAALVAGLVLRLRRPCS